MVSLSVNIANLCCVILSAAGRRLDVIITIVKLSNVLFHVPPGMHKVGVQ